MTFILTVQIDALARAFYEDLRQRHFPPERNPIPTHLSLSHQLPDEERTSQVFHEVATATPAFQLTRGTPHFIGRGVTVFFTSLPLASPHITLSTPSTHTSSRRTVSAHQTG
jgi:hypothetical protein